MFLVAKQHPSHCIHTNVFQIASQPIRLSMHNMYIM